MSSGAPTADDLREYAMRTPISRIPELPAEVLTHPDFIAALTNAGIAGIAREAHRMDPLILGAIKAGLVSRAHNEPNLMQFLEESAITHEWWRFDWLDRTVPEEQSAQEAPGPSDAKGAFDTSDSALRTLLEKADREPEQALVWIERFDGELAAKSVIRFAKVIALRRLIYRNASADDAASGAASAGPRFGPVEIQYAEMALREVVEIEAADPDYILGLSVDGDGFGAHIVDQVAAVLEQTRPGSVQETVGWTKLYLLGDGRLGAVPGATRNAPTGLVDALMQKRIQTPHAVGSALAFRVAKDDRGRWKGSFYLCRKNYNQCATVGDADPFGTVHIYDTGEFEFQPEGTSEARSNASDSATSRVADAPRRAQEAPDTSGRSEQSHRNRFLAGIAILVASTIAILLFLQTQWSARPGPVPAVPATYYVTRDTNVRSLPTTIDSEIIGGLARGAEIKAAAAQGEGWLRIADGAYASGFIYGGNVSVTPPPLLERVMDQDMMLAEDTDLYSAPEIASPVLDNLSRGLVVHVTGAVSGGFAELELRSGGVGYIRLSALD